MEFSNFLCMVQNMPLCKTKQTCIFCGKEMVLPLSGLGISKTSGNVCYWTALEVWAKGTNKRRWNKGDNNSICLIG